MDDTSADRISTLPEAILHHILSFLCTKDVIQIAATCKKLNEVWTTLPFLDFDLYFLPVMPCLHEDESDFDGDDEEDENDFDGDDEEDENDFDGDDEEDDEIPYREYVDFETLNIEISITQEEISCLTANIKTPSTQGEISGVTGTEENDSNIDNNGKDNANILSETRRKRQKIFTFVTQALNMRRMGGLTIQRFRLLVTRPDIELTLYLHMWIHCLVQCNIKDLDLQVDWHIPSYDLPPILLTARSLYSLYLRGCRMSPRGSVALSSLRKLRLDFVYLDEHVMKDIIQTCHALEDLKLYECHGFKSLIVLGHPQLRVLRVVPGEEMELEEVLIDVTNLEKFSYTSVGYPYKFNIITQPMGSLKYLKLTGTNISSALFFKLISKLPGLQELCLGHLNSKTIEISSHSLKRLTIWHPLYFECTTRAGQVKVEAPNLVYFSYTGNLSSMHLNNFAAKEVNLHIDDIIYRDNFHGDDTSELCIELMQFLLKFDYSDVVKLECPLVEKMIFPAKARFNLVAPLPHIKHLILEGKFGTSPADIIGELVDTLIWISPNLDSLSLKRTDWNCETCPIDLFVEFTYEEVTGCGCPWRCLRHCLTHVNMELKGPDAYAEVYGHLKNYFIENTENLKEINETDFQRKQGLTWYWKEYLAHLRLKLPENSFTVWYVFS